VGCENKRGGRGGGCGGPGPWLKNKKWEKDFIQKRIFFSSGLGEEPVRGPPLGPWKWFLGLPAEDKKKENGAVGFFCMEGG